MLLLCGSLSHVLSAQIELRLDILANRFRTSMSEGFSDPFAATNMVTYQNKARSGFGIGIGGGYRVNDHFTLIINPLLQRKGTKAQVVENGTWTYTDRAGNEVTVPNSIVNFDELYWAIHVPVMGQVRLPLGERFAFTGIFGPSVNFQFAGKIEQYISDASKNYPVESSDVRFGKDRFDDYNNIDISAIVGLGMQFALDEEGLWRLDIGARWDIGMMDMYHQARRQYLFDVGPGILGTRKHRGVVFDLGVSRCINCDDE